MRSWGGNLNEERAVIQLEAIQASVHRNSTIENRRTSTLLIKPSRGWAAINLLDVYRYHELIYFLTWRDIQDATSKL